MSDEEYIKNISSISTEELFNSLEYYGYDSYYNDLWRATIEELKKRAEDRPKGKWLSVGQEQGALGIIYKIRKCSMCGWEHSLVIPDNYCPHCGSDMRGEENG